MGRIKLLSFNSDKTNIYFTSDTHFGHSKVIEYCDRPFKDVYEMNEKLIENWNSVVKPNDIVFHLGDLFFGGDKVFESFIHRLNGKKYLCLGNHDFKNFKEKYYQYFEDVNEQYYIKIDEQYIYLNHFPFLTYGGILWDQPAWQLFGHIHSKNNISSEDNRVMKTLLPIQYDVGVDNNNYTPISYKDVKNIILNKLEKQE